jgi:hypothetical protein
MLISVARRYGHQVVITRQASWNSSDSSPIVMKWQWRELAAVKSQTLLSNGLEHDREFIRHGFYASPNVSLVQVQDSTLCPTPRPVCALDLIDTPSSLVLPKLVIVSPSAAPRKWRFGVEYVRSMLVDPRCPVGCHANLRAVPVPL